MADIMAQLSKRKNEHEIQGIIFDLDGTLIKSVVNFPKMKGQMIEYINKNSISDTTYSITQTTNEIIYDLNIQMSKRKISTSDQEKILREISEILSEVEFENLDEVVLQPGVKELLELCAELGIKLGILTRASREYTLAILEKTGITKYFMIILTRDEFGLLRAKPHPDALNQIIKELKVPLENIIFVGDHKIDFTAAKNGNIEFIGILTGAFDRIKFRKIGCGTIVQDFHELIDLIKNYNNL